MISPSVKAISAGVTTLCVLIGMGESAMEEPILAGIWLILTFLAAYGSLALFSDLATEVMDAIAVYRWSQELKKERKGN